MAHPTTFGIPYMSARQALLGFVVCPACDRKIKLTGPRGDISEYQHHWAEVCGKHWLCRMHIVYYEADEIDFYADTPEEIAKLFRQWVDDVSIGNRDILEMHLST